MDTRREELLLHLLLLSSAYLEAELKVYEALPAMTAIKATEIIEKELSHIPVFEKILRQDIKSLARELEEIGFIKKLEYKEQNEVVTVKVKDCRYARKHILWF